MNEQPWLRRVEVYIDPLEEWRGGGDRKLAAKIVGDGTTEKLRIRFEIHKSIISTPAACHVYIYNLGTAFRSTLREGAAVLTADNIMKKRGAQVELKIGWENTAIVTAFSGTLYGVTLDREGPDIVTTLICLAGYGGTSRGLISQTWGGGTKLTSIVKTMAGKIPGITIGPINITERDMGSQGLSHCGLAKDGLDKLARSYGFSWWIDKGIFHAVDDEKALQGREVMISYKNGTLLRAEPMLVSPFSKQRGTSIRALINPNVEPGHMVKLESEINPQLNGSYKVHDLVQTGDTHSSEWEMNISSFLQGEELSTGRKGANQ